VPVTGFLTLFKNFVITVFYETQLIFLKGFKSFFHLFASQGDEFFIKIKCSFDSCFLNPVKINTLKPEGLVCMKSHLFALHFLFTDV
jgi:hypothetical protein